MWLMTQELPIFKDFLLDHFKQWESQQPKKRSSVSAFARWLSENSLGQEFKQQLVNDWINGDYKPKDENFVFALAEKLGREVYEILKVKEPNVLFLYTNRN